MAAGAVWRPDYLQSRLSTSLARAASGDRVVTNRTLGADRSDWQLTPSAVIPGEYWIRSATGERLLDVTAANPAAGSRLQIWDRVGGPNQRWKIIPSPEPAYFFIKSDMGRYLDVQWGSPAPGTPVHIWDFNGGDAQKWRIVPTSDGQATIVSKLGTSLEVGGTGSVNGTAVRMGSRGGSVVQRWVLEPAVSPSRLHGWADLHTHPMSHLAFGKKLMHGAPDIGSIVPAGTYNCNPTDFRAATMEQALGSCNATHGGWGAFDNPCGDYLRAAVLNYGFDPDFVHISGNPHGDHHHAGAPAFAYWPHQTSVTHQQMWWEWIKRAHEGGLRVMVALAVNNELLAKVLNGDAPIDDKGSADLQLNELKSFVGRHSDFMEIARSPADLRRIVSANKLAVILGIEVDDIGNFNRGAPTADAVRAEVRRLYQEKDVRYIFPIHLTNNKFGGSAVYDPLFNYANRFLTGRPFTIATSPDPTITGKLSPDPFWLKPVLDLVSTIPYPEAFDLFKCPAGVMGCWDRFVEIKKILTPDLATLAYATVPGGHINSLGLTPLGEVAIDEMMRLGMLIDVDHMSLPSMQRTVDLAERFAPGGYPLMIGHNGIRGSTGNEKFIGPEMTARIARLGGVFGLGTADTDPDSMIASHGRAWSATGHSAIALGTDVNGAEKLPRATPGLDSTQFYSGFSKSTTGTRTWDYTAEGTAHYGLMVDFLRDVERRPGGAAVVGNLYGSAEAVARAWETADRARRAPSF